MFGAGEDRGVELVEMDVVIDHNECGLGQVVVTELRAHSLPVDDVAIHLLDGVDVALDSLAWPKVESAPAKVTVVFERHVGAVFHRRATEGGEAEYRIVLISENRTVEPPEDAIAVTDLAAEPERRAPILDGGIDVELTPNKSSAVGWMPVLIRAREAELHLYIAVSPLRGRIEARQNLVLMGLQIVLGRIQIKRLGGVAADRRAVVANVSRRDAPRHTAKRLSRGGCSASTGAPSRPTGAPAAARSLSVGAASAVSIASSRWRTPSLPSPLG